MTPAAGCSPPRPFPKLGLRPSPRPGASAPGLCPSPGPGVPSQSRARGSAPDPAPGLCPRRWAGALSETLGGGSAPVPGPGLRLRRWAGVPSKTLGRGSAPVPGQGFRPRRWTGVPSQIRAGARPQSRARGSASGLEPGLCPRRWAGVPSQTPPRGSVPDPAPGFRPRSGPGAPPLPAAPICGSAARGSFAPDLRVQGRSPCHAAEPQMHVAGRGGREVTTGRGPGGVRRIVAPAAGCCPLPCPAASIGGSAAWRGSVRGPGGWGRAPVSGRGGEGKEPPDTPQGPASAGRRAPPRRTPRRTPLDAAPSAVSRGGRIPHPWTPIPPMG